MAVNVPGLYSLTVGDVSPTLVNNDKYEPEQVLVITTSDAVRGDDLANVTQGVGAAQAQGRAQAGGRRAAL